MDEEREWDDPEPASARERRTRYRLVGGLVALALTVAVFYRQLLLAVPLLWPPGGARWFSLLAVYVLSLMLPLMVGAALGEAVARRRT
jgi:hypothetical protein